MQNSVDLNLYRFLCSVAEQKTQPKVCFILGISRSTFNRNLSELRVFFGNELFTVQKGVYSCNLFASQLIETVKPPLEQLDQAVALSNLFGADIGNTEFIFHIASPLSPAITSPLLNSLSEQYSKSKISIIDWSLEGIEHPKANAFTIGVSGYPVVNNDSVIERRIAQMNIYLYLSSEHPLAQQKTVNVMDLSKHETVRLSFGSMDNSAYYERIRKQSGLELIQNLTVSNLDAALGCLTTARYALVCLDIDLSLHSPNLRKIPLLLNGKQMTFDVGMQFHRTLYQHPLIKKIEKVIVQSLKGS